MGRDPVVAPVVAPVTIECEFWPESDGWAGSNPQLELAVRGNNFEEAKRNMEAALADKILSLLGRQDQTKTG